MIYNPLLKHGFQEYENNSKQISAIDNRLSSVESLYLNSAWYGIEYDTASISTVCTRIGNPALHVSLPIQSRMRRCLLSDNGLNRVYLSSTDSTKLDTGATADLSGASGQVMVEIPTHYRKFEVSGTIVRVKISEYALPGYHLVPLAYRSAYQATVDRTVPATPKLASVVNATANFRGGSNDASRDGTYRSQLGLPASSVSLTNFRTYARNRGAYGLNSKGWNCDVYDIQKSVYWLFVIEYAQLNSQTAYNPVDTAAGYKQGGLGDGVSTLVSAKWNAFNGYYPFIPMGFTNSCGNKTETKMYRLPFEYDCSNASYYKGVWNPETTYNAGDYVSSGADYQDATTLYMVTANCTNIFWTVPEYYTPITRTVVSVPTYRGFENPFGHIWHWTDGVKVRIQADNAGGLSELYTCADPALFNDSGYTNYVKRGNLPRVPGYVKSLLIGEFGDNMPAAVGGGSTSYMSDYFYISLPASGEYERGVLFGGFAAVGANDGLACAVTDVTASYASTYIGSRLCFLP